eukprot:166502-Prorocentrum_minimum.AAC.1
MFAHRWLFDRAVCGRAPGGDGGGVRVFSGHLGGAVLDRAQPGERVPSRKPRAAGGQGGGEERRDAR